MLKRLTEIWGFSNYYLKKATEINDHLERFKLVITYAIAGLHLMINFSKPFNPILGETFQGYYKDGSKIYCE